MALKHVLVNSKCLGLYAFSTTYKSILNCPSFRSISTSSLKFLDQRWREKRGLPLNPNATGVLTEGADYTFIDGRPTPYGIRHRRRLLQQQELAEQIITLSKEVDFAVERHKQIQIDEENRKKEIIANKLKPKGSLLLKNK